MELRRGQIVTSRRGRDVTHTYMVTGFDGDRVLLADGERKTLQQPKRKNIRHIQPTGDDLPPEAAGTDLELKTALRRYSEGRGGQRGG